MKPSRKNQLVALGTGGTFDTAASIAAYKIHTSENVESVFDHVVGYSFTGAIAIMGTSLIVASVLDIRDDVRTNRQNR